MILGFWLIPIPKKYLAPADSSNPSAWGDYITIFGWDSSSPIFTEDLVIEVPEM
jgi:hypothetical protein